MSEEELYGFTRRIELIEDRNRRVDTDKAWEVSKTRRVSISVLTYLVVLSFLNVIGADRPFLGSLVPVGGYLLSTQSMPFIRRWWTRRQARA